VSVSLLPHRSIRARVLILLASVALVTIGVLSVVSYRLGSAALERQAFDRLTAVRELKGQAVERYFRTLRAQVLTHSENSMIVGAVREFTAAVASLETEIGSEGAGARDRSLQLYYEGEFLPRLEASMGAAGPLSQYWPEDVLARSLQALFISGNPLEVGSKHLLDTSGLGVRYDVVHGR